MNLRALMLFHGHCVCSVTQSCPTLCDPMDCSLPDSSVHGIVWARILEWVAISFSRGSPMPSAVTVQSPNHWATREVPNPSNS